jgi:hypothetical protein
MAIHDKRNAWKNRYEPDLNSGCWLWSGGQYASGYGCLNVKGFSKVASRAFYELHKGPIPAGLEICHKCDTPCCVNPDHLWAGTKLQNQQDSKAKGRRPVIFGEDNPCVKLTERQVCEIYVDTRPFREIAKLYGIDQSTAYLIQKGKKWGWLTKDLPWVRRTHRWDPVGNVLVSRART